METGVKVEVSYCRNCGGDRDHVFLCEKTNHWVDPDAPVDGAHTWAMLECAGCHTVTFLHRHWFSEETEITKSGPEPIINIELYPPAPRRKKPEWGITLLLGLKPNEYWIAHLHDDIYQALGLKAYSLASMGIRAIVDFVVTSKVGDKGSFADKLQRMQDQELINNTEVGMLSAAFDAGSAAAHRGYRPPEEDVYLMLDVTEHLLQQLYIVPVQQEMHAMAAEALKARTPRRERS